MNIHEIKDYLKNAYPVVVDQVGKMRQFAVKNFNQGLVLARQDVRLAVATIAIANMIFLKMISWTISLADWIAIRCLGCDEEWGEKTSVKFVILTGVTGALVGMNVGLHQYLKSPLSAMASAATATAACAAYVLFSL